MDLSVADVPESEVWDISFFENFHIRLINQKSEAEIIDFAEWMERHNRE